MRRGADQQRAERREHAAPSEHLRERYGSSARRSNHSRSSLRPIDGRVSDVAALPPPSPIPAGSPHRGRAPRTDCRGVRVEFTRPLARARCHRRRSARRAAAGRRRNATPSGSDSTYGNSSSDSAATKSVCSSRVPSLASTTSTRFSRRRIERSAGSSDLQTGQVGETKHDERVERPQRVALARTDRRDPEVHHGEFRRRLADLEAAAELQRTDRLQPLVQHADLSRKRPARRRQHASDDPQHGDRYPGSGRHCAPGCARVFADASVSRDQVQSSADTSVAPAIVSRSSAARLALGLRPCGQQHDAGQHDVAQDHRRPDATTVGCADASAVDGRAAAMQVDRDRGCIPGEQYCGEPRADGPSRRPGDSTDARCFEHNHDRRRERDERPEADTVITERAGEPRPVTYLVQRRGREQRARAERDDPGNQRGSSAGIAAQYVTSVVGVRPISLIVRRCLPDCGS